MTFQRLRLFLVPLTFICVRYSFWSQGHFLYKKCMRSYLLMLIHSPGLGVMPWARHCWPVRQDPFPQSAQADEHSGHRTHTSNQRGECYSGVCTVWWKGERCWPHWGVSETSLKNWHLPREQEEDADGWKHREHHLGKSGSDRLWRVQGTGLSISPVDTDFSPHTTLKDLTPGKSANCENF